ncbi:hypothetical protein ACHAPT_011287 [Fusarium lateritium]
MDRDTVAAATRSTNPLLCDKCQIWDNVDSYAEWWDYDYEAFVLLQDVPDSIQCIICKAAMAAVAARTSQMSIPSTSRVLFRNDGPYFLDYDTGDPSNAISHRIDTSDPAESVVRLLMGLVIKLESMIPTAPTKAGAEDAELRVTPQFCLRYQNSGTHTSLKSVEPWEVPFFDVSLLKQWVRGCTKLHGAECKSNIQTQIAELPQGFRVINLHTMNVEEAKSALTYVALSYRWPPEKESERVQLERKNLAILEQTGGLAQIALPPIITDAMLLCKQLGEDYLWIDRFCIIQDDPNSKHSQIRGMDRIYRSANFTIMAALSGQEAWGLPGLVGRPRGSSVYKPARELEVELREIRPSGLSAAETSVWNTRGWTFQERLLSRRRLYITEHQVLFECCLGCASEELAHYPPHQRAYGGLSIPKEKGPDNEVMEIPGFCRWAKYDSDVNYHITDNTSVQDYLDWVANYTSRQLSFGSDVLNAFSGVGNVLSQTIGSDLIFGLPEKLLVQALMWKASDDVELRTRLPGIPSWSWASSPNKVNYQWITEHKEDCLHVVSLVYFHLHDAKGDLRKVKAQEWWVEREVPIEDFRHRDDVPPTETLGKKYISAHWRTSKTWKECPHNPWQTILHTTLGPEACRLASGLPGSLVFNTTVATLTLRRSSDTLTSGELVKQMLILDSNEEKVGTIDGLLPQRLKLTEEKQDFIVICGALAGWDTRKLLSSYPIHDFDQWHLYVMLVDRDKANPLVVRRVDVGYVRAHLWKNCAPRWETVVLC